MGSVSLPPLSPGATYDVNFQLSLDEGAHRVRLTIDPDNDVHEYPDQFMENGYGDNNQLVFSLDVREEASSKLPVIVAIILTALICLLLVILSIRILLNFKERVANPPESKGDPQWKGSPQPPTSFHEDPGSRNRGPSDPPGPPLK
jgi:hypothetical protein